MKDSVARNPVNNLKIIDTLLFVLYTPELLETNEKESGLDFPPKNYISSQDKITHHVLFQTVASNVISYLTASMKDNERSYVFFTPARYLNKFGNQLLAPLKERTDYSNKIVEHYSILDMIVGLLENSIIIESRKAAEKIIDAVTTILAAEKKIVLGTGRPQNITLHNHQKYFSNKNIAILFNLLSSSLSSAMELQNKIEKLFDTFKGLPDLFLSLQDSLNDYTLALIPSTNKILEDNIKVLKQNSSKLVKNDLEKFMENLNLGQIQTLMLILSSFVSIIYHYLFTDAKKEVKMSKKVYSLLQILAQDLFAMENTQNFMLNIYEIADLICKAKETLKMSDSYVDFPLDNIIKLCLYHYSILLMHSSYKLNPKNSGPKKQINDNPDLNDLPQLVQLVSYDETDATNEVAQLRKTFSHYKKQSDVNFKAVFANFGLKYSKIISQMFQTTKTDKDSTISYALTIILPRCPWILDLATKREIMK